MPRVSDQFYQSDEDEDEDEPVEVSDSSPSEEEEIADEIGVCQLSSLHQTCPSVLTPPAVAANCKHSVEC